MKKVEEGLVLEVESPRIITIVKGIIEGGMLIIADTIIGVAILVDTAVILRTIAAVKQTMTVASLLTSTTVDVKKIKP